MAADGETNGGGGSGLTFVASVAWRLFLDARVAVPVGVGTLAVVTSCPRLLLPVVLLPPIVPPRLRSAPVYRHN